MIELKDSTYQVQNISTEEDELEGSIINLFLNIQDITLESWRIKKSYANDDFAEYRLLKKGFTRKNIIKRQIFWKRVVLVGEFMIPILLQWILCIAPMELNSPEIWLGNQKSQRGA